MAGGFQKVYTDEEKGKFRDEKGSLLATRKKNEATMLSAYSMFIRGSNTHADATKIVSEEMRRKINDEELADKLIPEFSLGCRRFTVSLLIARSLFSKVD
jgi:hypothetical protein